MSIFLYDVDFVDWAVIGELARRSVGKHSNSVRKIHYISHICYVSNINSFLKTYRCPSCDQFIKNAGNVERHLKTCKELVERIFQKNMYQLRELLFDKLDSFGNLNTGNQKLFNSMAIFDFESVWKMKNSRIPKQQHGLGNTFQFLYR